MQQSSLVGHLPFALGLGIGALSSLRVYRGAQYLAQLRDKDIDRRRGQSCSQGWTARCFSGSACFVLQAAFFRSRNSLSTSSGVRYPRAE